MSSRHANNLTGIWQGLYSYPQALAPVGFTATLLESGSWLSGSVHEVAQNEHGADVEVYATLLGTRKDQDIDFTKTYDGTNGWTHAVFYRGCSATTRPRSRGHGWFPEPGRASS